MVDGLAQGGAITPITDGSPERGGSDPDRHEGIEYIFDVAQAASIVSGEPGELSGRSICGGCPRCQGSNAAQVLRTI